MLILCVSVCLEQQAVLDHLHAAGAVVDKSNQFGWSPLHHAAMIGDVYQLKFFIDKRANVCCHALLLNSFCLLAVGGAHSDGPDSAARCGDLRKR